MAVRKLTDNEWHRILWQMQSMAGAVADVRNDDGSLIPWENVGVNIGQLRAALAAAEEKVASLDAVYEENAGAGDELTPLLLQGLFDRLSEVPLLQKACRGLEYDLRTVQKRELRLAKQLRERAEKAEAERDEATELRRRCNRNEQRYINILSEIVRATGGPKPGGSVYADLPNEVAALRSRVAELEGAIRRVGHAVTCPTHGTTLDDD